MSEISGLSNQYERLSIASDNLNEAIIIFKKKRILSSREKSKKYPSLSITNGDITQAKAYITKFIKGIKKGTDNKISRNHPIPISILSEYKEKLETISPYILEEIFEVLQVLEQDKVLNDEHFITLENLLTALDFERTVVFKKLRSGRV